MPKTVIISPSILSANFAKLGQEVNEVLNAGADAIHFDVMDNHYVPNLSVGPMVCRALRDDGITAPIDVHLMVEPIDDLITAFAKAGASHISIHPESTKHLDRSLQLIHDNGCQAGLAFNPSTSLNHLDFCLEKINTILIMLVNPGFGGQKLLPGIIPKITQARALAPNHSIQVDGGVNKDNIAELSKAGANNFVAGNAIFGQKDRHNAIKVLRHSLMKYS
jgi:ribulose-phosphate 3-epimerase